MKTTEARFWEKVNKTNYCWNWTASKRNKGYGAFCYPLNGRIIQGRAHRYSWELHFGTIPPGLFVLHRCDNPACVRPDHLLLGTNEDNIKDMLDKGRHIPGGTHCGESGGWRHGSDHHAAKLSPDQVREMRRLHSDGGWSYGQLGKHFGVNGSAAYKIVKRLLWRNLD